MLVIRTLPVFLLPLFLLGACVSVPEQARLINSNGETVSVTHTCNAKQPDALKSRALNAEEITLASWNIYKQSKTGWEQDLTSLNQGLDVLLLQEAHLHTSLQDWLHSSDLDWDMSPAFDYKGVPTGVITAGRAQADVTCSMIRHEPYIYIPKAALISYYPINGSSEPLLVANVHGINFTLNIDTLAEQLSATMDIIRHHQGPVIVAGDFNTWSQQRLRLLDEMSESLGLTSVTFEGQQPATHMGKVVDHIYYRDLDLLDSQVVAVDSSDHFPLKVRFALNQAGNIYD